MKHPYNRVVVLLNDFEKINTLLERAIHFSKEHKTILEILYVHEEALFDIPDYFLSNEKIDESIIDAKKIKEKIQNYLDVFHLKKSPAILVYIDDTVHRLLTHLTDATHTLILSNYNEKFTPKLIEKTPYNYWIIKNNTSTIYNTLVCPTDLSDNSKKIIKISQHIFNTTKIHLLYDYRYILDTLTIRSDYMNVTPIAIDTDIEINENRRIKEKKHFDKHKKVFNVEGTFLEGNGLLGDDLVNYINDNNFNITVLYRKDEELFSSPSLILMLISHLSTDFLIFQEEEG